MTSGLPSPISSPSACSSRSRGLLSADNALVMAIMVLGLPEASSSRRSAMGLIGGFAFRIVATLLAVYLIRLVWVKLLGGVYSAVPDLHRISAASDEGGGHRRRPPKARPMLGLSAFWATVVRVELINLAFSIDSILVAVAMSPKTWVVVSGGILGIVAMRLVGRSCSRLVERYPALVDGAFVIIAWVGIKLSLDYLHAIGVIDYEIPQWFSLGLIAVIFVRAVLYARAQGPVARVDTARRRRGGPVRAEVARPATDAQGAGYRRAAGVSWHFGRSPPRM